jgi:alkanesulfonate monooxygenase SsuD/methylene tetrahydromethanopterin reductase-like flavin-dependent oxidoreductase (luciferase family)
VIDVPEAVCYPRPVQDQIPVIVGGSGNRTLRLATELADGCNLLTSNLDEGLARLHDQFRQTGRNPDEFLVTVLDVTVCGTDRSEVGSIVEQLRGTEPAARVGKRLRVGTVDEHIGRYRQLAELGIERVYVGLADLAGPETVERFAPVVAAFA